MGVGKDGYVPYYADNSQGSENKRIESEIGSIKCNKRPFKFESETRDSTTHTHTS